MFSFLAAPVLLFESIVAAVVAGLGLTRWIRIDRRAGLAVAGASGFYAVAVVSAPLLEAFGFGLLMWSNSSSTPVAPDEQLTMAFAAGVVAMQWLGPLGRSAGLVGIAYGMHRLAGRVPAEAWEAPVSGDAPSVRGR